MSGVWVSAEDAGRLLDVVNGAETSTGRMVTAVHKLDRPHVVVYEMPDEVGA